MCKDNILLFGHLTVQLEVLSHCDLRLQARQQATTVRGIDYIINKQDCMYLLNSSAGLGPQVDVGATPLAGGRRCVAAGREWPRTDLSDA